MKISHTLQLHFLVILWGFTGIFGKLVSVSAIFLVWWRMFVAMAAIYLYLRARGISLKVTWDKLWMLLGGGLILALHWGCFFHAIGLSNVSVGLSCLPAGALFMVFLEPIFFRRAVRIHELLLAVVVAFCLVAILYSGGEKNIQGVIFGILAAFLLAFFSLLNVIFLRKNSPQIIAFYEMMGGAVFVSLLLLMQGGIDDIVNIGAKDLFWVLLLGTVFTAYPMVAVVRLMKNISPYTLMLTLNLEPVYGILIACFLFGSTEKMGFTFYIAVSVMLSAIFLNQWIKKRIRVRD